MRPFRSFLLLAKLDIYSNRIGIEGGIIIIIPNQLKIAVQTAEAN
jgi:hypothetical protein